ncbi:exonuclease domain-containing protein [Microbulbifer sp. VAAF005]|nr:3'-5' exonuclease [Microbulbifer sp. VAAF005]WHI49083.1 exonuclease domain-containing protein [Microbulbifer sp. VAAF005]
MNHLLVVDLEATCWDDRPQSVEDMEVIEFGLAIASLKGEVLASHSELVKPTVNPILSSFCSQLTGIDPKDVLMAPSFEESTVLINKWLENYDYQAWASWGKYDYNQIQVEQERHNCAPIFFDKPHINLKALWQKKLGKKRRTGLGSALKFLDLEFEGQPHRGEDDACNIARILPQLEKWI